ncbi:MAG: hypothetical protein AB7Q17_15475, partial [Phycisphaerae bacterium]
LQGFAFHFGQRQRFDRSSTCHRRAPVANPTKPNAVAAHLFNEVITRDTRRAEQKGDPETQDILEALERGLEEVDSDDPKRQIQRQASIFWQRWKEASFLAKIKSLVSVLKNRRLPWRLTHAAQRFRFAGDACTCDLDVFYEIDDVRKWIIVREFAGLPTQG